MRQLLTITGLLISVMINAQSPVVKPSQNIAVGLSHKTADSALVSTVNIGLAASSDTLKGLQAGVVTDVVRRRMHGFQLAGVSNVAGKVQGVQIAGMSNISHSTLHGIQLSAVSNITMGVDLGTQVSLVTNISAGHMRGVQAGAYNYADTVHGLQIGLFNVCIANPRGTQIGLVNYSRDTLHHRYGLINIHPDTQMEVLMYGGTSSKLNMALRLQNRRTYNIIGLGTHYHGLNKKFSGAVFYRIGKTMHITDRWRYGVDLGFYHIETFEENTDDVPERMYSIQPRLTTDYRLTKSVGLHAALGYESTHYYDGGATYRQGLIFEAGLSYHLHPLYSRGTSSYSTTLVRSDYFPSSQAVAEGRASWIAAAEVFSLNALVNGFDRFILHEDYAKVTWHSIGDNFKNGFVWDNDRFSTNMFDHPYHGNLYYNAARSNGLSFWQSCPYALGGSLMWEFFGENLPPSTNDVFATSIGGIALGETAFRISSLILDDSRHGWPRFWRELLAGAVNPMRGLNRIISGDAWKRHFDGRRGHDFDSIPVRFSISAGIRYLADKGALFRGEYNPYVDMRLDYGDPMGTVNRPYDFFTANITLGLPNNQPLVNAAHLTALLWAMPINADLRTRMKFGVYQHFNFYNSEAVKNGSKLVPYRIGEAASLGPGIIYRFPRVGNLSYLEHRIFLSGILLGGSLSDYYRILERDYNLGSGFSAKVQTKMLFNHYGRLALNADFYKIWTWKGYNEERISELDNLEYANAQGDVGNATLFVLAPRLQVNFSRHLLFDLYGSYYYRRTYYRDHPNISVHTFEVRAGLTYEL